MTLLCVYRLCFDHCACVYLMVCISRRAFVPFSHCHAWPWVPDCPLLEEFFGGSFVSYQTTKFVFFSWKNEKLLPYVALIAGPRELRGATVCDSVSKCRLSLPGTWWCIEPTCTCTVEFVQLGWRKKKKGLRIFFHISCGQQAKQSYKNQNPNTQLTLGIELWRAVRNQALGEFPALTAFEEGHILDIATSTTSRALHRCLYTSESTDKAQRSSIRYSIRSLLRRNLRQHFRDSHRIIWTSPAGELTSKSIGKHRLLRTNRNSRKKTRHRTFAETFSTSVLRYVKG